MARPAHPARVSQIAERLQKYFDEDGTPLVVQVRYLGHQGMYVAVSRPGTPGFGLTFHADQLDNGAAGFKIEALDQIRAYVANQPYVKPQVPGRLDYSDVMSLSSHQEEVEEAPLD